MNGVEFYRGSRRDFPPSRSYSERYDKIGGIDLYKDYHTESNGYNFYTGDKSNNTSTKYGEFVRGPADQTEENPSQDTGNISGSIKSFDSTGKQKSFRRLITRFAEKTSMQGVPYINNAKFWWARLIWCFMLLVAIVAMSLHLWYLIDQYTDYPVQTKISLGFQTLKFPEITICNANVMHKGRLDKYDDATQLKELLDGLHPENLVPHQYNPNYDPFNAATTLVDDTLGDLGKKFNDFFKPPGEKAKEKQVDNNNDSQEKTDILGRLLESYEKFNENLFGGKKRPDHREFETKDEHDFDGELDSRTEVEELFKWLFMSIPKRDRAELGHNITDMLISCTFNGRKCSSQMFTLHQTTDYGNCWSISSDKFKVKHSGPSGEVDDYLRGLTTGYGTRIQIHEQRTYPFPTEEGLFIPAYMETDIGLRMRSISRESGLYGDCNNGKDLEKSTTYKYTRSACQHLCLTDSIMDTCHCYDKKLEELATIRNNGFRPCRNQTEIKCMTELNQAFIKNEVPCTCSNPCNEIQYVKSVSQRQWPDDEYAMILLESICDRDPGKCILLREFVDEPSRMLCFHSWESRDLCYGNVANKFDHHNKNFLKLNIYYEDLNYENLTEVPEIEVQQFLSDVGGAIGLWIGLSILSLCELVQLFVELCDYGIHKTIKESKKGRRQRRKARRKLAMASTNDFIPSKQSDKLTGQNYGHRKIRTNEFDWPQDQHIVRSKEKSYNGSDVIYDNQNGDVDNGRQYYNLKH